MAEKYLFFNSTITDRRKYQASDMAAYWQSFLFNGVINEGLDLGLQVTKHEVGDRTIVIQDGRATIHGHLYINEAENPTDKLVKVLDGADATLSRIDRVVLRFDNTIDKHHIKAFVKKGEYSANPEPPTLTRGGDIYELSLAQILVSAGKSFIEQSDITDERLNESVCGQASSLVQVPTDVFNQQFSDYMQQIALEWQDWYNTMSDASFVTQDEYKANNRDVSRQLANLNAIADIDNRAVGNTGKFYDLFDGTNDRSIAKADVSFARTSADIANTTTNQISCYMLEGEFAIGDEVTIFGLTITGNSASLQIVTRTITDKNPSYLTLNSAVGHLFKIGTVITRSTLANNRPSKTHTLPAWNAPTNNGTKVTMATVNGGNPHKFYVSEDGKHLITTGNRYFRSSKSNNFTLIETFASLTQVKLSDDGRFRMEFSSNQFKVHEVNQTTGATGAQLLSINTNSTAQEPSGWGFSIGCIDQCYFKGRCFFIVQAKTGHANIYEYSDGALNLLFESAYILGTQYGSVHLIPTEESLFFGAKSTSVNSSSAIRIYKIEVINNTLTFHQDIDSRGGTTTPQGSFVAPNARRFKINGYDCIGIESDRYQLATTSNHTSRAIVLIYKPQTDAFIFTTIPPTYTSGAQYHYNPISVDKTGEFITFGDGVIYRVNSIESGLNTSAIYTVSASQSYFSNEEFYNNVRSTLTVQEYAGLANVTLPNVTLRYKLEQPIKNLAGWLITNATPTSVQADLSLVNANEHESYQSLTVTQNGNEYEFLETENLYTKDKATLKLTIEGTANLNKLLGAVE